MIKSNIEALGYQISIQTKETTDYISLTDLARFKNAEFPADVVKNWLSRRNTVEYLGFWEQINNPNFKLVEFHQFENVAGTHGFVMSPQKWIKTTNAIGLVSKSGNNGGTFAHSDIAFKFASWLSVEFELYVIKDYQRLKTDEGHKNKLEWNARRELARTNYRIHTDAIKENLILAELTQKQKQFTYASEGDLLNVALFGMTAQEWQKKNTGLKGNIRDYASIEELIILSNIESMNSELIKQGLGQEKRLVMLRNMAKQQAISLINIPAVKRLKEKMEGEDEIISINRTQNEMLNNNLVEDNDSIWG